MKKSVLFLGAILLIAISFFSSCSDNTDPVPTPPTISFVAGSGYISSDATLTVNTPFVVKILAEANTASNSKIQSISITRIFSNQVVGDTTFSFNDATVSFELTIMSFPDPGVENIEFEAMDKDGQKAKITLKITTEEGTTPINTFTMKVLGSYESATGSSFASIDGNVYTMAEAFAKQASIDFLYWWGASTSATIGAPDDDKAILVYTGVNGLPNWTTKNATRFKTTLVTATEFDAIDDGQVLADKASGADQTRVGTLAVDNVLAFITVTGKHGLIKVTNITTGTAGDITIDVKVEQ